MENYDPFEYWNQRENPNTTDSQDIRKNERNFIAPLIKNTQHLLEFGPGVGRLFSLYAGKKVSTLDLSRKYSDRLHAAAASNQIELIEYFRSSTKEKFPFTDNEFQIGIVSQVLFHVPFDSIHFTVSELTRTCQLLIVVNTHGDNWIKDESDTRPFHCFAHDFLKISNELKLILTIYEFQKDRPYCFTLMNNSGPSANQVDLNRFCIGAASK